LIVVTPALATAIARMSCCEKFGVTFDNLSRGKQEQCDQDFFDESQSINLRLDQLSRNEDFPEKLKNTEWDLSLVDEAHKLSANILAIRLIKRDVSVR